MSSGHTVGAAAAKRFILLAPPKRAAAFCLAGALTVTLLVFAAAMGRPQSETERTALFRAKILPLLAGKCVACHNPQTSSGGLDLTKEASARRGGANGVVLIPGDAEKSRLYKMISSRKMPPGAPLSVAEIETVKKWIYGGADWNRGIVIASPKSPEIQRAGQDWWSLKKPARSPLPKVKNAAWVRNPIDAFILAKLESQGLTPAPPADRQTLIRRVTFDLLGVPPTPQETDAFLRDTAPNAYEKLVDRLLADPRYGERWGRHWLDVARFAESQGFERDAIRENAWRYRDYVIQSLNADKPYNQFVKEQIAGDVLEHPTQQSITATGFLVAGPFDEAGKGAASLSLRKQIREEELEDVLSVVGQSFLGLTVNCARCHDHKFDPIPQRDYYRLKAVFEGVQPGNRSIIPPEANQTLQERLAMQRRRISELERDITAIEQTGQAGGARPPLAARGLPLPMARWDFANDGRDSLGSLHGTLFGDAKIAKGRLRLNGNGAYMQTAPLSRELRVKTLEAWVSLADLNQRGGGVISVEAVNGSRFDALVFGEREPGKWIAGSESFQRTKDLPAPSETSRPEELVHLAVVYRPDNSISLYRNGVLYGTTYTPQPAGAALQTYSAQSSCLLFGLRHTGAGNGFFSGEIASASLYNLALTPEEITASFRAGIRKEPLPLPRPLTAEAKRKRDALQAELNQERETLRQSESPLLAYAATSQQPEPTFILIRGDIQTLGEQVAAGGLSAVKTLSGDFGLPSDAPEGFRRRQFADWVAHADNPLTARVMVNRVWHYHFGRGIVGTPNDFGFNGDRPTHPELLDWLAAHFVEKDKIGRRKDESKPNSSFIPHPSAFACGWSLKKLHRLILLSNTYRQSSQYSPKAAEKDAEDHWLWRFAPQRLEGEAIRDAMLCVSGQINAERGGPSFRPFTVFVNNSHFYTLTDSAEPTYNRRTVYRINVNSAKSPLLDSLDCPDPSTKTPRRSITTTPLQALELMNNSFVIRQSRGFAARIRKEAGVSPDAQIRLCYRLALGRSPTPAETTRAMQVLKAEGIESLCWALLNSSEFLYVK